VCVCVCVCVHVCVCLSLTANLLHDEGVQAIAGAMELNHGLTALQ